MPPVSLRTTSSPASRRMSKSSGLFLPKDRGVARTFMTGLLVGKCVRRGRRSLPAGCPAEKGRAGRGRAVHALGDALCGPGRFCAGGRGLRPEPSPAGGFVNAGRGRGQVPVFLCLAGGCRVQCAKKCNAGDYEHSSGQYFFRRHGAAGFRGRPSLPSRIPGQGLALFGPRHGHAFPGQAERDHGSPAGRPVPRLFRGRARLAGIHAPSSGRQSGQRLPSAGRADPARHLLLLQGRGRRLPEL